MELKWVQISYKTFRKWAIFLLFPLILVAASWFLLKPSGEAQAQDLIEEASVALREATTTAHRTRDPQDMNHLTQAAQAMEQAKNLHIENDYQGSMTASRQVIAQAHKILERNRNVDNFNAKVRFDELIGEVLVKRADTSEYLPADKNMTLDQGDMIKTSPRSSCRLVFYDNMITVIQPESLVTIKDAFDNRTAKENFINLRLETGQITLKSTEMTDKAKPSVLTRSGSAMVYHSSQVEVDYSALQRLTELSVYRGKATAATGSRTMDVRENQRVSFSDDRTMGNLVDLPPPPVLLRPDNFEKYDVNPQGTATVLLGWRAVDPTASYHVELSPNILFTEWAVDEKRYFRNQIEFPQLTSGVYFWRVASIDSNNVEGAPSEVRQFQIGKELISDVRTIDTKPPNLSIKSVSVHGYYVIITGKTEKTASVTVDGQKAVLDGHTGEFNFTANMPGVGIHRIQVVAEDPAGNRTVRQVPVEIQD